MHLIWFATVWVLWKERNDRIFNGKERSHYQLLEAIKLLSFWWFKAKFTVFPYCFHNWCQAPFLCAALADFCLVLLNRYCISWLSSEVHLVP